MSLSGKTALVTGGGRGIGRAIAAELARAGAHVIVSGRSKDDLERTAGGFGGTALLLDLSSRAETDGALDQIGRVDILVNNAGMAESAPLAKTSDETWDRTFELNVTAPFRLCRTLAPRMVEAGWGRIVNVASNAGRTGYAYTSAYCASKHALVGLTRALASELARTGVTVNAVCPGWVATGMALDAAHRIAEKTGRSEAEAEKELANMSPQRRLMDAAEVAHMVAALCSPAARGVHGQAIPIDGGQVMA